MFVAGPFATAILADLGAEVVKIEPPGGDPVRANRIGPQIGAMNAQFHTFNRGKASLVLDLKTETGCDAFRRLVPGADIVFDNFRPGVMARLGLDHAALAALKPEIVAVSLSAFGAKGPWAKRPGYDLVVQALGGGMSLTGHPETGPAHIPFHLGDTAGGLYAAIAMLSAVLEARRTGHGRAFEVSMLDAQLALLGDEVTNHFAGDWPGEPHGAGHPALAPYSAYPTADHPLVIAAVGTEVFWHNLLGALGLETLADDARFADNAARSANRAAMDAAIVAVLQRKPRAAWLDIFQAADVPAAPILSISEAVTSPHAEARGLIATVPGPDGSEARVPVLPIRPLEAAPFPPSSGTPALDTAEHDRLADDGGDSPTR